MGAHGCIREDYHRCIRGGIVLSHTCWNCQTPSVLATVDSIWNQLLKTSITPTFRRPIPDC
eukprot:m.470257 g.470257  ORF g.470257 m.470257 type:complete len:61 (+) comp29584_c0_seq1:546-728(+)